MEQEDKSVDTQQIILDTAMDLFIKNGYKKTTLREISRLADVNLGLIPYYYGNKESLGAEAFRILVERIREKIDFSLIPLENSIEKFYYRYIMTQYYLNTNIHVNRFYNEFLVTSDFNLHLNSATENELAEIVEEYHLGVTGEEILDYCTVVFGAERALLAKKNAKKLKMSYWKINETLATIALCLVGIEEKTVEDAVNCVNQSLQCIPYNWSIME